MLSLVFHPVVFSECAVMVSVFFPAPCVLGAERFPVLSELPVVLRVRQVFPVLEKVQVYRQPFPVHAVRMAVGYPLVPVTISECAGISTDKDIVYKSRDH